MEQIVSLLFKYRPSVFAKSRFSFAASPPLLLLILLVAAILILAYFFYSKRSTELSPLTKGLMIGMRAGLIGLIALCVMRPVIVVPEVVPQSSFVAVLMDDSASMRIADEGGQSRLEAVQRLMTAEGAFYKELASRFKVRAFKFSAGLERAHDAGELTGNGQQSNLAGAIEQASRELAGVSLSGLIVVSDGAQTEDADVSATLNNLRSRGIPVFTIGVGKSALTGDIELVRATAPRRALAGSTVMVELLVRASGLSQKSLNIDLTEDSHPLRSQAVPIQGGESVEVVRIAFTPSSPGVHRYVFSAKPVDQEPVVDNNRQELLIKVEDAKPRVLHVEGEPRWEYGKLRGAVAGEKNLLLISLLRSAEGKFYRQGVETPEELATGFPKSEEDLFKYDAVVLGSVEATFFTFDQLRAVEQFVSRRGGALLAIGGTRAFNAGGYSTTPLADVLPVSLRGEVEPGGEVQAFKAAPSERGRDHIVARLNEQNEANRAAWDQLPGVTLPELLSETKPGATVILEARSVKERGVVVPLLVEQRYGRGRSFALMASDTWRWRMMLESKNKSFETFWRGLLRYMVESARRQVEAHTERTTYGLGEQARLRVEVADKKYNNVGDAQVTARITGPSGQVSIQRLGPSLEAGFEGYTGSVPANEEGIYHVAVTASRGTETIGVAETSFIAGRSNREAFGAAQNEELLRRIASETGGAYYAVDQGRDLIDELTHSERGDFVHATYDLWDMPVNFLLIIGLAAAEWFLRKRKGLA